MSLIAVHDLMQEGRRVRTFVLRVVLILAVFCIVWIGNFDMSGAPRVWGTAVGLSVFMRLALTLVAVMMLMGFSVTLPGITAELEGGTLQVLMCSKLTPKEIVFSKVFSGGIVPLSIVLACTPMMAMATFYGGVAPTQALAVFALLASLSLLCSAVGARIGLDPRKGKSPYARVVKWLLLYNIITLPFMINPFGSVVACTLGGSYISIMVSIAVNVILFLRVMNKTIAKAGEAKRTSPLPVWLDENKTTASRGIFVNVRRDACPMNWKELQEGQHSALYAIGTFIVCMLLTADVFVMAMGGMNLAGVIAFFKAVFGCHLFVVLFFCVMILSQIVSVEREKGTLSLMLLSGLSPSVLLKDKIGSLKRAMKPLLYSGYLHALMCLCLAFFLERSVVVALSWALWCCALVLFFALYCAIALFASTVSRSGTRSLQASLGIFIAGMILPVMISSKIMDSTGLAYVSLGHVLVRWPENLNLAACAAACVCLAGIVWGLWRLCVRRLREPPNW